MISTSKIRLLTLRKGSELEYQELSELPVEPYPS
jgi:hypothetical protein